jgi:hypothetical protein
MIAILANLMAWKVIGNRDPKLLAKREEIHRQYLKQALRDKLINPEFAFLTRSDIVKWEG